MTREYRTDLDYIPADYDDLYRAFFAGNDSLAANILRKKLPYATSDESVELVHEGFCVMMESDMLERFDPEKSNFGGVVFFVMRSVIANYLRRESRKPIGKLRGPSIVSGADPDDGEGAKGTIWAESLSALRVRRSVSGMVDLEDRVDRIFLWAENLAQSSTKKRESSIYSMLSLLFEGYRPCEIGRELGVSGQTITNWMDWVGDEMPVNLR